jgi:hypothetical protein
MGYTINAQRIADGLDAANKNRHDVGAGGARVRGWGAGKREKGQ